MDTPEVAPIHEVRQRCELCLACFSNPADLVQHLQAQHGLQGLSYNESRDSLDGSSAMLTLWSTLSHNGRVAVSHSARPMSVFQPPGDGGNVACGQHVERGLLGWQISGNFEDTGCSPTFDNCLPGLWQRLPKGFRPLTSSSICSLQVVASVPTAHNDPGWCVLSISVLLQPQHRGQTGTSHLSTVQATGNGISSTGHGTFCHRLSSRTRHWRRSLHPHCKMTWGIDWSKHWCTEGLLTRGRILASCSSCATTVFFVVNLIRQLIWLCISERSTIADMRCFFSTWNNSCR